MVSDVKDNDKEWLFCFYKLNAIAVEQYCDFKYMSEWMQNLFTKVF